MKKESRAPQLLMKLKRKGFWSRKNIFWKEKRFLLVIGEKKGKVQEEKVFGEGERFSGPRKKK